MRHIKVRSLVVASLLVLSTLVNVATGLVGGNLTTYADGGATKTWTGTAGDKKFSTAGNWQGGVVPVDGDSLVFNNTSNTVKTTLLQDIPDLSIDTITSSGTNETDNFEIDGDFTLTGGIVANGQEGLASNILMIGGSVSLGADVTLSGSASSVEAGSDTPLYFMLNGHNINVGVTFEPTSIYYNGNVTINSGGWMAFGSDTGRNVDFTKTGIQTAGVWQGTLTINNGDGWLFPNSLPSNNPIVVNDGSTIILCGSNGASVANPLTVGGHGSSYVDGGTTYYNGAIDDVSACGYGAAGNGNLDPLASVNWTGPITLTSDTLVNGSGEFTVSGALSGNYQITQAAGTTGKLTINSSNNTSGSQNGIQNSGALDITWNDQAPSVDSWVNPNSVVTFDGTRQSISVSGGGTLKGTGTTEDLDVVGSGTVAPGHSPGKLTVSQTLTLETGSIYQAELKDSAAGDYDQIQVSDPSRTTGQDVNIGGSSLQVSLYDGYNIKAGDKFTIINNLQPPTQLVVGTFAGLPEGGTVIVGDAKFTISYVGGDGNDVVLTAVADVKAPNTGFERLALNNPIMVIGATVAMIAGIAFFVKARKLVRR